MGKGLGVAALVVSILAIFVPIVTIYVIWLSLVLAAVAGLLGDKTFPIAATLANLVNILFMSPVTLMALTGENLDGGSTPLMTTTTTLFIAPIVTLILGALKRKPA
jgi:hypothetical protein